jgi:DNA-binding CsgD family transcriptional regulator
MTKERMETSNNKCTSNREIANNDMFRQGENMSIDEFKKYLSDMGYLNFKDLLTIILFGFVKSRMTMPGINLDDIRLLREIMFAYNYGLTKDLMSTLKLMAKGHKNHEIADLENISTEAIAKRNRTIFRKLGVHNRIQAIQKAIEKGIT